MPWKRKSYVYFPLASIRSNGYRSGLIGTVYGSTLLLESLDHLCRGVMERVSLAYRDDSRFRI